LKHNIITRTKCSDLRAKQSSAIDYIPVEMKKALTLLKPRRPEINPHQGLSGSKPPVSALFENSLTTRRVLAAALISITRDLRHSHSIRCVILAAFLGEQSQAPWRTFA
jgi:hypothetical protein